MKSKEMKIVAVLGLKEYEQELKKLFKNVKIPVFSEIDIRGFRMSDDQNRSGSNWFAHPAEHSMFSVLHFVFLEAKEAERILAAIEEFNNSSKIERTVHAYMLDVEKMV